VGLLGTINFDGDYEQFTLKDKNRTWQSGCTYKKTITFTKTGLSSSTVSLPAISFRVDRTDGNANATGALGLVKSAAIPISAYSVTYYNTSYYLNAADYGTATNKWHGPSITRLVPADALGYVGAANFTLTYKQKMCMKKGTTMEVGSFQMQIADANGANIAGIRIVKHKAGKSGNLIFYVNGKEVNSTAIDLHYNNNYFGSTENAVQTTTVQKSGATISFAVGSYKRQFTVSELAEVEARAVTFQFEKYSTSKPFTYNGLYNAKFVKNNCATYKDVPNKFSANDVLEADCKTAQIYLNGITSPGLGALGNDWEKFYLSPGINQIGVSYSEWVTDEYAPTCYVRYREVFL
jgi:hypothetical protein